MKSKIYIRYEDNRGRTRARAYPKNDFYPPLCEYTVISKLEFNRINRRLRYA